MHAHDLFPLIFSCLMGVKLDTYCYRISIHPSVHLGTREMLGNPDKMLNANSMMDQHEFMGKYIITRLLDVTENSDKRWTDERLGSETDFIVVRLIRCLTKLETPVGETLSLR